MALRVWLPLNGNLENKGISEITLASGTPTYTNGKIGQCLNTGTLIFNLPTNFINNLSTSRKYSICCWCKNLDASASTRWVFLIGSGTGGCRGLWESNATNFRHWAYGGSGANISTAINTIDGQWHHIVFTSNSDNIVKLYVDGIYQSEITSNPSTALSGANTIQLNATNYNLNDFRIYDHCLSPKEVKEISRGLILHYRLNGFSGVGENLLKGTKLLDIDTTVQGTKKDNDYKGFSSSTYDNTSGTTYHEIVSWANKVTVSANEVYTASFYAKSPVSAILRCYFYNNASNIVQVASGVSSTGSTTTSTDGSMEVTLTPEWKRYWITWTFNSTATSATKSLLFRALAGRGELSVCGVKLEKGNIATEWCPSVDELWIDTTKIKDCSGFENDGTITGSLKTNYDAERYKINTSSVNGTDYIKSNVSLTDVQSFSCVFWVKPSSSNGAYSIIASNYNNPSSGFWIATNCESSGIWFYNSAYAKISATLANNTWHHCAVVCDNKAFTFYINGVAQTMTQTTSSSKTITVNNLSVFNSYTGSSWNTKNYSELSDFRFYVSALSADDIKDLYNQPCNIDNLGNIYSFELNEKEGNLFATSFLGGTMTYDATNKYYVITSGTSTSTWGIGPNIGTSPQKVFPWGTSYIFSYEVYTPTAGNWMIDYNNYGIGETLTGNDNDTGRLTTTYSVPANQWTLITHGCSNTNETKNPNHVPLYDGSTGIGPVMQNQTEAITWYMRNPQWYLVDNDNTTNYEIKKNGIIQANFFKEDSLNEIASFRKNERAIWANNFIEK